jgi:Lipase (class 3)
MEDPHNYRRRIVMNKHQGSIKPALLAAAIAATVLVSAANGQAASSAGGSGTAKAAPVAQDQRTPVVTLTETIGDVGFEIFGAKTPRYSFATLPKNVDDAVLYIDVDSPQWNTKQTHAALKLARKLNWVVMAESATWDVPRLHAFLATHFPGTSTKSLENVAVRIGWDKGRAVTTDLTPSEAAVEVGIDYLETTEGRAAAAKLWRDNSKMATKTLSPGSKLAWFANEAYASVPQNNVVYENQWYGITKYSDVLKVYSRNVPLSNRRICIVAWRGTWSPGDILRDAQLQFGTLKAWSGDRTGAKFGHGYIERYKNQIANVHKVGCTEYSITGHSLGGGMAQLHAYLLRSINPQLETYNSARTGNAVFYTLMKPSVTAGRSKLFCRNGDPVASVPTGMVSAGPDRGCTLWAPRVSFLHVVANHGMQWWL